MYVTIVLAGFDGELPGSERVMQFVLLPTSRKLFEVRRLVPCLSDFAESSFWHQMYCSENQQPDHQMSSNYEIQVIRRRHNITFHWGNACVGSQEKATGICGDSPPSGLPSDR